MADFYRLSVLFYRRMVPFCRYIGIFLLAYVPKKPYICTKKSGDSPRLGQILEFMLFSKAIQIKSLVNRFNQERQASGFAVIKFDCGMYSIGHWSVSLSLSYKGCFFSSEMAQFAALLNRGGIIFFVGSNEVSPVLHFQ